MWHDEFEPIDLKGFVIRYAPGMCKRWDQTEKGKQQTTTSYTPFQAPILKDLKDTYSPYIGEGVLGGLSDLEEKSLGMLQSANVWDPLVSTGKGLLTGTMGAEKTTPETAGRAFDKTVAEPALNLWKRTLQPDIKESYAGPGYWGSARAGAEKDAATELGKGLSAGREKWMWDVEQSNKAIDEARAGRALSALGAAPSSLLGWTTGLARFGNETQRLLNTITDPQVLNVLTTILGTSPAGGSTTRSTSSPSQFQQILNWRDAFGQPAMKTATGGVGEGIGAFLGG
ncbi:MAG TPA: hypothetical protein HPP87_07145 [Planctomycetes bacterium]|nr:hypothetical protein [Planctomycetota bacterium]